MLNFSDYCLQESEGLERVDEVSGWILANKFDELEKQVFKQNLKFGKLVFEVQKTGRSEVRNRVSFIEVKITGRIPRLENFEVIGSIDHVNGLIFQNVHDVNIEKYRNDTKCELCGRSIARNATWIIRSTKDETVDINAKKQFTTVNGTTYSVGGSCLKKLAGTEIFNKLKAAIYNNSARDSLIAYDNLDSYAEEQIKMNPSSVPVPIDIVIDTAGAIIEKEGFAPSSSDMSTKQALITALFGKEEPIEIKHKIAEDVKKVISAMSGSTEFVNNLRSLVTKKDVTTASFGYIASMVNTYFKMKSENIGTDSKKKDNSVFEKGKELPEEIYDPISLHDVKVKKDFEVTLMETVKLREGSYGSYYLVKLFSSEGYRFTWFANASTFERTMKTIDPNLTECKVAGFKFILSEFSIKKYENKIETGYSYIINRPKVKKA